MRTLFTITILFFRLTAVGQVEDSRIAGIRKSVQQINFDTPYKLKRLESEKFLKETPDNGAELTGYFKNGQLVKIVEWIGLSSCVNVTEYYLKNNSLIFVYTRGSETAYIDSLETFDQSKVSVKLQGRFYYEKNKIIKTVVKGSTRCEGELSADKWRVYLENYFNYRKLLIKN